MDYNSILVCLGRKYREKERDQHIRDYNTHIGRYVSRDEQIIDYNTHIGRYVSRDQQIRDYMHIGLYQSRFR